MDRNTYTKEAIDFLKGIGYKLTQNLVRFQR